ncbi:MAG: PAS domain-containing protein [Desulfosarcina sp.]|nr:PAS domain-containing protein [Desulfosarcina sp.]
MENEQPGTRNRTGEAKQRQVRISAVILFCNHRFADIVQWPREQVVGSSINRYFSSDHLQLFQRLVARGLKDNKKKPPPQKQSNAGFKLSQSKSQKHSVFR